MRIRSRFGLPVLIVFLLVVPTAALAQSVVGVLGIPREVTAIEQRLENRRDAVVKGHTFRVGTINGREVVVGRCGAGKVNAAIMATLLIVHFNPSALFFSGTAGAVDPGLRPGDVVVGAIVGQHDTGVHTSKGLTRRGLRNAVTGELDPVVAPAPATLLTVARRSADGLALPPIKTREGERNPRIMEGVIVTGDTFIADAARRDELHSSLGAAAVEMEGAAVAQTCRQFGTACLVIRSITDHADGQAHQRYEEFRAIASENAATLVAAIIARLEL